MEQQRHLADTTFNCYSTGEGPVLIFAHCSSASYKEWRFLFDLYRERYQIVAPDLLGYGANPVWSSPVNPYAANDLDLIESLLPQDRPYHLIGHSYGGALCLEVARRVYARSAAPPQSLFLIEPVAVNLLQNRESRHWREFLRISQSCITAVEHGNFAKAAAIYMGFWIGHLRWLLAPRQYKQRIIATMAKVAHEFGMLAQVTAEPSDYKVLQCPLTLATGTRSPDTVKAVADLVLANMPFARHIDIKGAGHMSPFTHPEHVKEALAAHLDWAETVLSPRAIQQVRRRQ